MFRRFLSNSKKIKNMDLARFETGNWMEHIKKLKEWRGGGFHYNNVPTYNEGEALNELEGKMPGLEINEDNVLINDEHSLVIKNK